VAAPNTPDSDLRTSDEARAVDDISFGETAMSRKDFNAHLQAAYLEVVDNQLRDNDPPETRQTFDRLRTLNIGERDAKLLIASAIACETFEILKHNKPFDKERFIRHLRSLPDQSFLDK
jgi:hypothetical protein